MVAGLGITATVSYGILAYAFTVFIVPVGAETGWSKTTITGAFSLAQLVAGLAAIPVWRPAARPDRVDSDVEAARSAVAALIFILQGMAVAVLLLSSSSSWSTAAVWAFVILFGAGFGAITPARAAVVAELFGSAHYGRIGGAIALATSLARAAAPVGASLLYAAGGTVFGTAVAGAAHRGYDAVLVVILLFCLAAGAAVLVAGDRPPAQEPLHATGERA